MSDYPAEPSRVLALYGQIARWLPTSRRARISLAIAATLAVVIPSVALLLLPIWFDFSESSFESLGYVGVFVANLASTATVFVPVPGLTAAGQALIVGEGSNLDPVLVGVLGGTGMALGEITAYLAGGIGREVARGREMGGPGWFRRTVDRLLRVIGWLMGHHGMLTLFVLSVIPNPIFELAGLTAGAVRMNFSRFMLAVLTGKVLRGLILAFVGAYSLHVFWFD